MKKITGYKTITGHFHCSKDTRLLDIPDETFEEVWNMIRDNPGLEQFIDRLDLVIHYPPEDTPQQEAVDIIRSEIIRVCNEAKHALDNLQMFSNFLRQAAKGRAESGVDDNGVTELAEQLDHFHGDFQKIITERIREARKIKAEPLRNGYVDTELETAISAFFAGADGLPVEVIDKEAHRLAQHGYANIRQGIATNTLTKIRPTKRNTKIDPITGTATIKKGVFTLTISNYREIADFRTSAKQLLDALTEELTARGAKDPVVTLPLAAYMEKRGLSDRKEARKQVEADLDLLYNASISFKEKRRGQEADFLDVRICDAKGISRGIITFSFGSTFYSILKKYPIMPVVPKLYQIKDNHNPYSYALLRRMMEHKNMNAGKKNENIISVKTLLEACENMPSYKDVMATDRRVRARIIDPFERDLNELADTLSWHYCHSNNEPLTDEELDIGGYDLFTTLLINFNFYEWPDQTERLQRKAERTEAAKKKSSSSRGRKKAAQA